MTQFHLETTAGALAAALKIANMVRAPKSTIPILGAVLLDNRRMVATNLDQEVSVPFAATKMQGRVAVHGSSLGLLRLLDADTEISIHGTKAGAMLSFPGGSYDLPSFQAEDFPVLPDLGDDIEEILGNGATGFPQAMAGVRYAISTEETRYYLNGVALGSISDEPCVTATDGHRLAWQKAHVPFPESWHGIIIPHQAVTVICGLGVCDAVQVGFEGDKQASKPHRLRVKAAGVKLTTKLIDGKYPDWHAVVPKCLGGHGHRPNGKEYGARKLVLPVAATRQALRRLVAGQSSSAPQTGAKLSPQADGRVALSCRMENELAVEVLPLAESMDGIPQPERLAACIGVNVSYLLGLLAAVAGDDLVLVCEPDHEGPDSVIGSPFGFVDERGGHILMPSRPANVDSKVLMERTQMLLTQGVVTGQAA